MIDPDEKLTRMLFLFKVILAISIALIISKAIYWLTTKTYIDLFSDILCTLLLIGTIYTLFFIYGMLGLFLILYRIISCLIQLGIFFQHIVYQEYYPFTIAKYGHLGLTTFEVCFVIFCFVVLFPTYKEMKAQYIENVAGVDYHQQGEGLGNGNRQHNINNSNIDNEEGDGDDNNNNGNRNNNNNHHGFQAFQGVGVQVGGD